MKTLVVSAYVPLQVKHMSPEQYRQLGDRLVAAVGPERFRLFEHPLEGCWLHSVPNLPWIPAAPVPADRYATPEDNIKSHIVNHNRTEWAMRAAAERPDVDVIVWFDYGILKQGAWRNNPILETHVQDFLTRVENYPFERSMPFPGIEGKKPVNPFGNNWRFCGSTHVWPVRWLPAIDSAYKTALLAFIDRYKKVPLDLAIWPEVEEWCTRAGAGPEHHVPFEWYQAEYDASQLTNFPGT